MAVVGKVDVQSSTRCPLFWPPRTCAHVQAVCLLARELSPWFVLAALPPGQAAIWRYQTWVALGPVLDSSAWHKKDYTLGGFKQQKRILPQFWRLDAPNQVVSRAVLPLRLYVEAFLASSQLLVVDLGPQCSLTCSRVALISAFFFFPSMSPCLLLRTPVIVG